MFFSDVQDLLQIQGFDIAKMNLGGPTDTQFSYGEVNLLAGLPSYYIYIWFSLFYHYLSL